MMTTTTLTVIIKMQIRVLGKQAKPLFGRSKQKRKYATRATKRTDV